MWRGLDSSGTGSELERFWSVWIVSLLECKPLQCWTVDSSIMLATSNQNY
jgi:hypothetical protein